MIGKMISGILAFFILAAVVFAGYEHRSNDAFWQKIAPVHQQQGASH